MSRFNLKIHKKIRNPDFNKSGQKHSLKVKQTTFTVIKMQRMVFGLPPPPSEISDPGSGPSGVRPRRL